MRCTTWLFSAPQKMSRDPSVGTGAAAAVTVGTGRMVPSVETVSQVSGHSASVLAQSRENGVPSARGWGLVGVELDTSFV